MTSATDTRRAISALGGLALANARYWSSAAGQARAQLRHWRARAEAIEDPELRELALAKLRDEGFNAQAAAVLATLAPRAHRPQALRAIVALELLFDCLDGLSEQGGNERLFDAYIAAVDLARELPDDPYLTDLAATVRAALATLPAGATVAPIAARAAARAARAQVDIHAGHLSGWRSEGGLNWREQLAGAAASVLTLHALIAAAADPRTSVADAERIDRTYASICALVTLLDCVVDERRDEQTGELAFVTLYEDREELALALAGAGADAARRCAQLPGSGHHLSTLAGTVAYWASDPAAREQPVAATLAPLRRELRGLLGPPLLVMRAWRAAKRAKAWRQATVTDEPAPC